MVVDSARFSSFLASRLEIQPCSRIYSLIRCRRSSDNGFLSAFIGFFSSLRNKFTRKVSPISVNSGVRSCYSSALLMMRRIPVPHPSISSMRLNTSAIALFLIFERPFTASFRVNPPYSIPGEVISKRSSNRAT